MVNQPLLDYLRNVLKLEVDQYICEETIQKNNSELHRLQELQEEQKSNMPKQEDWGKIAESKLRCKLYDEAKEKDPQGDHSHILGGTGPILKKMPPKPSNSILWRDVGLVALGVGVIGLIIGFILSFIFKDNNGYILTWGTGGACALIGAVWSLVDEIRRNKKDKETYPARYKKIKEENEVLQDEYLRKLQKEKKQLLVDFHQEMEEYKNQMATLDAQIESMISYNRECQRTLSDIQAALGQMYDAGIIINQPKYRGLVPVSMYVGYLERGACYTLEGINGAYNKYDQDLNANIIISKLD